MESLVEVKVSAAMARQQFHPCTPEFIRDTCHAKCCDSRSAPAGMIVHIAPHEIGRIGQYGGKVKGGLLQPAPGQKGCPFKAAETKLCTLHEPGAKPQGCVASPFTFTNRKTLVVRNRYRRLPCFKHADAIPAFEAFRASLDLIFGPDEAARIAAHLRDGGGDLMAQAKGDILAALLEKNETSKRAARGGLGWWAVLLAWLKAWWKPKRKRRAKAALAVMAGGEVQK